MCSWVVQSYSTAPVPWFWLVGTSLTCIALDMEFGANTHVSGWLGIENTSVSWWWFGATWQFMVDSKVSSSPRVMAGWRGDMPSAGKGLWTWNWLQVLPQAGCVGQVESLPLYKRERLKLMKRLRQMSALKLLYATAYKSDFHVRGTAFGSIFSGGGQVFANCFQWVHAQEASTLAGSSSEQRRTTGPSRQERCGLRQWSGFGCQCFPLHEFRLRSGWVLYLELKTFLARANISPQTISLGTILEGISQLLSAFRGIHRNCIVFHSSLKHKPYHNKVNLFLILE